jgi:hypothetical protein
MSSAVSNCVRAASDEIPEASQELKQESRRVSFRVRLDCPHDLSCYSVKCLLGKRFWPLALSRNRSIRWAWVLSRSSRTSKQFWLCDEKVSPLSDAPCFNFCKWVSRFVRHFKIS